MPHRTHDNPISRLVVWHNRCSSTRIRRSWVHVVACPLQRQQQACILQCPGWTW